MRGAAFCRSASSELESEVACGVGSTPTYEVSVTRVISPSASVEVRVVTTALDDVGRRVVLVVVSPRVVVSESEVGAADEVTVVLVEEEGTG